jgi:CBS-domain-containing membrane protein
MRAKDIMTRDVIVVKKGQTVEEAVNLLADNHISGLPVVDDEGHVVGIVSEGDLLIQQKQFRLPRYFYFLDGYILLESFQRFQEELKKIMAYTVDDIMTADPVTVYEDATIEEMATIMSEEAINRLPVLSSEGKLVGIVSRADIVRAMAKGQ